jgi:hypothetical protein
MAKMRYLIFGLLFFAIACSQPKQQIVNNNSVIDSTKLFDPYPQEDKLVEPQAVLCNCIMLEGEKISASIGCQKIELQGNKELKELLQNNVVKINKQKFYIVYSNNTSGKRVFEILGIVKKVNIDDYKVITLRSLLTLNGPPE